MTVQQLALLHSSVPAQFFSDTTVQQHKSMQLAYKSAKCRDRTTQYPIYSIFSQAPSSPKSVQRVTTAQQRCVTVSATQCYYTVASRVDVASKSFWEHSVQERGIPRQRSGELPDANCLLSSGIPNFLDTLCFQEDLLCHIFGPGLKKSFFFFCPTRYFKKTRCTICLGCFVCENSVFFENEPFWQNCRKSNVILEELDSSLIKTGLTFSRWIFYNRPKVQQIYSFTGAKLKVHVLSVAV